MNRIRCTFAVLSIFTLATWATAQPAGNERSQQIDVLVRKLGSGSFVQREQARKQLEEIGPDALESLRRAAKDADLETARRIADLIDRLAEQQLTKQILAPKEVDLKLEGVTVQEAIAELAKASGYQLQFQGDATPFADRKVTLTGKMSFWQAFDKLCEQGGLQELITNAPAMPPMNGRIMRGPMPLPQPTAAGSIKLVVRGKEKSLVSHAGCVKTEVRISRGDKSNDLIVTMIVSTEPSLLNVSSGRPFFGKLLDERGRKLDAIVEPAVQQQPMNPYGAYNPYGDYLSQTSPRVTQFRIKSDDKLIKEMAGNLSLQLDLQNVTLAKVPNVMQSAGKSVDGANGGSLKIQSVKKLANDAVEVQLTMHDLIPNPFGNNIVINGGNVMIRGNINGGIVIGPNGVRVNGGGNGKDLPDLLDAKGQKFKVASVANDGYNFVNGYSTRTATIVFQPNAGQTEPRELVLFGTRTHTIAVPFRFENVPVP